MRIMDVFLSFYEYSGGLTPPVLAPGAQSVPPKLIMAMAPTISTQSLHKSSQRKSSIHATMAVNGKIQNSNLSYYFTEYCDNSTIHGLKFLGERQRSWIEKIWWIFFVSLSLYLCTTLILSTYNKWMTSPVIVSFATSETPISEVPFPAVTICPLMKTDLNKFNFNEVSSVNYTSGEAANLTHLSLICPRILELFPDIQDMEYVNGDAIDFLIDILPDFDASIRDCKFCGDDCHLSTRNIFTPVLTSNAICYSFNVLDWLDVFRNGTDLNYYNGLEIEHQLRSTWNTEDGYLGDSQMYPRRTATTGTNGGLELTLTQLIQDASYNCGNTLKGFKIMIHHPGEMARFHQHYFWLPLDQLVSVSVKPNMITTHENLRDYKPKHRWCYFQDEISLKYFKIYNQQNCVLECVTNFTLPNCPKTQILTVSTPQSKHQKGEKDEEGAPSSRTMMCGYGRLPEGINYGGCHNEHSKRQTQIPSNRREEKKRRGTDNPCKEQS
ncbi:hypothetical protein FQA39_LY01379 [Lamprigera yunnana]|nr:hypothetical protein FQA39_LY01379 [Lamprigera yunnana]